jgi:hypothetical protein
MNAEKRKELRQSILAELEDDMMPLEVGNHTITNQLVYAGCSQWCQKDREWDDSQNAYAYIVDGEYQLSFPNLDYFDGHNNIERQTKFYLQPDRSEDPPGEPIGEPLLRVPNSILLEIAKGLVDAVTAHAAKQEAEDVEAQNLIDRLSV